MHSCYDVIVVGGGIVGATTALALAQQTALQVALVDVTPLSCAWDPEKPAHRVSAISLASQRIFQQLHVWDAIQARRVSPYQKMQVWDAEGDGSLQFDGSHIHVSALGYIVEDAVMRAALFEKIAVTPAIDMIANVRFCSLQEKSDYIELVAEDGRIFKTKLVVAADGAHSWVREQADITLKSWDYHHHAIVATVETELPHQLTAWQRFLPTGPLAFLPLADPHQCSIVWSTSPAEAERLLALEDKAFEEALARAFDERLGRVEVLTPRMDFHLTMRHAKNYVRSRLVLVGDAAHTIHPLAGQGVNLGLLDVACLVEVIAAALAKTRDFAGLATLRRYERWRKSDNIAMLAFVEAIKRLFSTESSAIKHWRNAGLNLTNRLSFVKNFFANYAVGERGDMPRLAQRKM